MATISNSYDIPKPAPNVVKPTITYINQPETPVKPVPRPRLKLQPRVQNDTNNIIDSGDKINNETNASSKQPAHPTEYVRLYPVRAPPKPPNGSTPHKHRLAVNEGTQHMNSNTEPTVKPPAVSPGDVLRPPRPERPPSLSIYYDGSQPTVGIQSRAMDSTSRPVVPPRLTQSSLPRSVFETSPHQIRPPPPPFNPPPPPSTGTPSEAVYSEIETHPYLDVLPEDENKITQVRKIPHSGLCYQSGCFSSCNQTPENEDDLCAMLRWLTRVTKSQQMTPSLYGFSIEEEIRQFNQRATNVSKALFLYNVLMKKRSESLRKAITEFNSISDCLDKLQKTTKTMGIAGSTTGAVGGVTAVVGIALAPVTMGASLIATAVGAGMVASATGMGAHSIKANKKIVNRMTVEKLVYDYKSNVADLDHCLDFILSGMNELRRHDIPRLQRAGAQPDALKIAHLSHAVFRSNMNNKNRTSVAQTGGVSSERLLLSFVKELDLYFTEKDDQKLKKSNKSRFSGRVRLLAENLQEELGHLNHMWEMFS
ncbi:pollen-specific leucine-rich repeat extensin-like protein 2 isoform X2 [Echeneis naucrates]|nr:pollen-specific leucine-rich repeat extensin-like protein 2 isoform X2 [Echeneis naucrates]